MAIKTFQMRSKYSYILHILFVLLIIGCSEEELAADEAFFKIYDESTFDLDFDPIDVVEVNDGYVILTGTEQLDSDFDGIQLIKVDEEGEFVAQNASAFNDYESAVGDMYFDASDSSIYFFAKVAGLTIDAILISIEPDLTIKGTSPPLGFGYPLASNASSNGNLLILSYDPVDLIMEFRETDLTGSTISNRSAEFSIGAGSDGNIEQLIINHFTTNDESPIPFFCGEYSGGYFFNGFVNFSLSTVFLDAADFAQTGLLQGQPLNDELLPNPTNAGLRSVMALGGSSFAIAGFQFQDNFQLSSIDLPTSGNQESTIPDLFPGNMAEIRPHTESKIFSYSTTAESYTVFASETKSNQIVLHFYNATTGEIDGVHYIGFLNRFNLASVKVLEDGSILVLGTTFVAGRFERIFLNKISPKEIAEIL